MQYDSGTKQLFVTDAQLESGEITMFGIQTAHQAKLWKKLTPEIVIVDSTACVSKYKHVLYSIVSIEDIKFDDFLFHVNYWRW